MLEEALLAGRAAYGVEAGTLSNLGVSFGFGKLGCQLPSDARDQPPGAG